MASDYGADRVAIAVATRIIGLTNDGCTDLIARGISAVQRIKCLANFGFIYARMRVVAFPRVGVI